MNPILEQVARAICKAEGIDPDGKITSVNSMVFTYFWQSKIPVAKAAVQALIDATVTYSMLAAAATARRSRLLHAEYDFGDIETAEFRAMLKQILED